MFKNRPKYKSNAGLYIITFIVTAIVLALAAFLLWNNFLSQRPQSEAANVAADYSPEASLDVTVLFMLGEAKGAPPEWYLLLNYRPHDNKIVAVPLRPNTLVDGGRGLSTLSDVYAGGGGAAAVSLGIKRSLGVDCTRYIKFDKSGFTDFISLFGEVPVNVPQTVRYNDVEFSAGSYTLAAEKLYGFLNVKDYGMGDDYRYTVQGAAVTSLVNNCARNLPAATLQNMFMTLQNTADMNFTFADFTDYQKALLYTTEHLLIDSASSYLPYGSADENGGFTIAPDSVNNIQSRFAADGELLR